MVSLQSIVDTGHTLFVIEHHAHVLAQADWILEMGPGAGMNGGEMIASGSTSKIGQAKNTNWNYP